MLKKPSYFLQNQEELLERAMYYYKDYCKYNICEKDGENYFKTVKLDYYIKNERI